MIISTSSFWIKKSTPVFCLPLLKWPFLSPLPHDYSAEHSKQRLEARKSTRSAKSTSMMKSNQSCEKYFIRSPSRGTSVSHTTLGVDPFLSRFINRTVHRGGFAPDDKKGSTLAPNTSSLNGSLRLSVHKLNLEGYVLVG